jgi:hypothetical protein
MIGNLVRRLKFRVQNNSPLVWHKKWFLLPRILNAPPQPIPESADLEIHALVGAKDFVALLWALRSFYYYSGPIASATVHDDGTLTATQCETLAYLFPGVRVIPKSQSDQEIDSFLAPFPNCQRLRKRDLYTIKVFDFPYYARAKRIILLDSDVLFFRRPSDLIMPCQECLFNADVWTCYIYSTAELRDRFGLDVPERINIGLGAMDKECFRFDAFEGILADHKFRTQTFIIDQTLIAIMASQRGVRLLGPEYRMSLSSGLENVTSKHYTRVVRHLFYLEGLPRLAASGIVG